jgi:hypothetical protein
MGQEVRLDRALSVELMHALLGQWFTQAREADKEVDQAVWINLGCYFTT